MIHLSSFVCTCDTLIKFLYIHVVVLSCVCIYTCQEFVCLRDTRVKCQYVHKLYMSSVGVFKRYTYKVFVCMHYMCQGFVSSRDTHVKYFCVHMLGVCMYT